MPSSSQTNSKPPPRKAKLVISKRGKILNAKNKMRRDGAKVRGKKQKTRQSLFVVEGGGSGNGSGNSESSKNGDDDDDDGDLRIEIRPKRRRASGESGGGGSGSGWKKEKKNARRIKDEKMEAKAKATVHERVEEEVEEEDPISQFSSISTETEEHDKRLASIAASASSSVSVNLPAPASVSTTPLMTSSSWAGEAVAATGQKMKTQRKKEEKKKVWIEEVIAMEETLVSSQAPPPSQKMMEQLEKEMDHVSPGPRSKQLLSACMAEGLMRDDMKAQKKPRHRVVHDAPAETRQPQPDDDDAPQSDYKIQSRQQPQPQQPVAEEIDDNKTKKMNDYIASYPFNTMHSRYGRFEVHEVRHSTVERRTANSRIVSERALLLSLFPDGNTLWTLSSGKERDNITGITCTQDLDMPNYTVVLTGVWASSTVHIHDIVHVIGRFDEQGICKISNDEGILVVNPDHLIPVSSLTGSLNCLRRAHFMSKYVNFNLPASLVGVTQLKADYGTMLHRVFQQALEQQDFSRENLLDLVQKEISEESMTMFVDGKSSQDARDHLNSFIEPLHQWARQYWDNEKALGGAAPFFFNRTDKRNDGSECKIKISSLVDVEESIWSTAFGLTGNVDATIETKAWNESGSARLCETMPLEVKSGRSGEPAGRITHRAQLISYQAMMADKYNEVFSHSLLYYMTDSKLLGVPFDRMGFRDIITTRNELVQTLSHSELVTQVMKESQREKDTGNLDDSQSPTSNDEDAATTTADGELTEHSNPSTNVPDIENVPFLENVDPMELDDVVLRIPGAPRMSNSTFVCRFCIKRDTCMLYARVLENRNGISRSGIPEAEYLSATSHITDAHAAFVKKWLRLIDLEEMHRNHFKKEIWCLPGPEREERGRCLSCLVASEQVAVGDEDNDGFLYIFKKHPSLDQQAQEPIDFKASIFAPGSYVIISTEYGHTKISSGVVRTVFDDEILVHTKNKLRIPSITKTAQSNPTSTSSAPESSTGMGMTEIVDHSIQLPVDSEMLWRIDVDDFSGLYSTLRSNILQLLYGSEDQSSTTDRLLSQVRQRVIDLVSPAYETSSIVIEERFPWTRELNTDQMQTLQTVVDAKDYALILGMPGTGKTTTIVSVIRILAALGKKVLVSAYTHSALDNILLKLQKYDDVPFVRFGSKKSIHAGIHRHMPYQFQTTEQVSDYFEGINVFASTCLSMNSGIFSKIMFDYCIIDEAGQITLPAIIGPIRFADKFVLVGDHNQLPPLVQSRRAIEYGMQDSLFGTLCRTHPSHVISLKRQYRMNSQILQLSNSIIYDNQLICGNEDIAKARLEIPRFDSFSKREHPFTKDNGFAYDNWLPDVLHPERRLVFVNTDQVPASEGKIGRNVYNATEAELVVLMITAMAYCQVPLEEIGVMCPVQMQVSSIRTRLVERGLSKIDVLTIDKFQGTDKRCIILSLVRSNKRHQIHEIMRDKRRVNVALTRAKHKLIILGSLTTHCRQAPIYQFMEIMRTKNFICQLPEDAHLMVTLPYQYSDVTNATQDTTMISQRHSNATDEDTVQRESETAEESQIEPVSKPGSQAVQKTSEMRTSLSSKKRQKKRKTKNNKSIPSFTLSASVKERLTGRIIRPNATDSTNNNSSSSGSSSNQSESFHKRYAQSLLAMLRDTTDRR